jgi:predicted PhzF superfamily epimerase YddE/YHI9
MLGAKTKGNPSIINVGPRWLVAEMADAAAVGALVPDMQSLADLSNRLQIGGVTVYGASADGRRPSMCARLRRRTVFLKIQSAAAATSASRPT